MRRGGKRLAVVEVGDPLDLGAIGLEPPLIHRPDEIDDLAAHEMAKEIATEIEDTMQYPGQIQVTVIRETRAVTYAK